MERRKISGWHRLSALLGLMDSRGRWTSAREILSQGSAAATLRLEIRRPSGSPDWTAEVGGAGDGRGDVAGAALLRLDFCRSLRLTLD